MLSPGSHRSRNPSLGQLLESSRVQGNLPAASGWSHAGIWGWWWCWGWPRTAHLGVKCSAALPTLSLPASVRC